MKSLFKRTLAAASSSILVLSQLSAVAANLNVSAADEPVAASGSVTTIDKEFVLFVPIDKDEPMNGLHSDWNDKLETALLGMSDKTFTTDLERAKKEAKKVLLKSDRIDSATADDILAALSEVTVKATSAGKATVNFSISDIGEIVGGLIEQEMRIQNDGKEGTVGGKPVKADWTKLTLKCDAQVDVETDFDAKTVSYKITLTDENGKKYTDYKGVEEYVLAKVDEAATLLKDAAAKNGGNTAKFNDKLDKYVNKAKSGESYIKKMIEAVAGISVSASDLDTLYTDYTAKLVDAAKGVGAPEYYTNKAVDMFESKKPATVSQFWTDERVTSAYDKAVSAVNSNFGEYVNVQLPLSDIQGIVEGANSAEYTINGYSAQAILNIDDDKAADVEKAIRDKHEAEWLANGYKIVSISSSKKITAKGESDYGMSGSAFYDVERIITVVTEPITTTTTTSGASDTTTTTTTTTTKEGSDVTTTTTKEGSDVTTTTTKEGSDVTTTTTTKEGSDVTTTTTTKEGSDVTTTTQSETSSTTTTAATYVSFEFKGIEDDGLVYWSEEDSTFDLSNLSVTLHFYEAGIDQTAKAVEVTSAFTPEYTSPSQMTMPEKTGLSAVPVFFKLTDAAAVQKAVKDAGYDDALIEQEGIKEGLEAGNFTVYLVLRGDSNLDGVVSVEDAQYALIYYTETQVSGKKASNVIANTIFLNPQDDKPEYLPYVHYAMDVWDGNGVITVEDAQTILRYYTNVTVAGLKMDWDHAEVAKKKVVPLDELHKEPLARDNQATEYVGLRAKLREQG